MSFLHLPLRATALTPLAAALALLLGVDATLPAHAADPAPAATPPATAELPVI